MLSCFLILLTILEITAVYFAVLKLRYAGEKILILNKNIVELQLKLEQEIKKIKQALAACNKILKIITDERIYRIKKIIDLTISFIEIYTIIKSFKKSGIEYKNVKKLLLAGLTRKLAQKIISKLSLAKCRI